MTLKWGEIQQALFCWVQSGAGGCPCGKYTRQWFRHGFVCWFVLGGLAHSEKTKLNCDNIVGVECCVGEPSEDNILERPNEDAKARPGFIGRSLIAINVRM